MKSVLIYAIALLTPLNYCFSQWIQTDGPYGITNAITILKHDSILLTSTNCGYFSKNQIADRWTLNSTLSFSCFSKKGDSLFVGNRFGGIHLIDLNNLNNPTLNINSISANALANTDSTLYLANETQGFLKSNNFGNIWNSYNSGLPVDTLWNPWVGTYYQHKVTDIELSANYMFCGTKKGVYRNDANLINWTSVNTGLPLSLVTFVKNFNDTLYTAISNSLYRSADFGNSWNLVYTAPSNISTIQTNNNIYIGTNGNGVYYSTDNGVNWSSLNTGLNDLNINTLEVFDSTLLCGTNSNGIFYLQNGQWLSNEPGMICSFIKSIATTNQEVISNDNENVYKLNSTGNWIDISPTVPYDIFGSLASNQDTLYLSIEHNIPSFPFDDPFIVFSFDNGNSWNNLINPVPFVGDDPYRLYMKDGRLHAYDNQKMFYTDNLGLSWTDISLPGQYCNMFNDFIINNSIPFSAACGDKELLKFDNSQNWVLSNNGLPTGSQVSAFASCDTALFAYLSVFGMYVSFDNGNQWNYAGNGLVANNSIRDFVSSGSKLFVTSDNGVFATSDYGLNWVGINNGLKNLDASSIEIFNDTLYVGSYGNGIWKRSIDDIQLNVEAYQESDHSLKIYPNPASDYIHVATNSNEAKFKLTDMIGREVLSGTLMKLTFPE